MGYYIEVSENHNKAEQILELHGGRIVPFVPIWEELSDSDAIICVFDNGPWEAAGFAFDKRELERFAAPDVNKPQRPRTWLVMDREKVCKLTGYPS